MAGRNFYERVWDFHGQEVFTTTAGDNASFKITKTAAAGTPTFALVTPTSAGSSGELAVSCDVAQNEVQNVCLSQNDILQYLLPKIIEVEFRVKMNQATLNAASMFAFGLASARNDTIASLTNSCLLRLVGASNIVKIDTRDGTVTNNGVSTSKTLGTAYSDFLISFAAGLNDIRFFQDGQPLLVPSVTKFDMSNSALAVQIFMQIQHTAVANGDGFTVDRIRIAGRR